MRGWGCGCVFNTYSLCSSSFSPSSISSPLSPFPTPSPLSLPPSISSQDEEEEIRLEVDVLRKVLIHSISCCIGPALWQSCPLPFLTPLVFLPPPSPPPSFLPCTVFLPSEYCNILRCIYSERWPGSRRPAVGEFTPTLWAVLIGELACVLCSLVNLL